MTDIKALYDEVKSIVDVLPQRNVIPDAVADSWINGIIRLDPSRAVWHAKRAGGIGGSEIGELLLEDAGEPPYLQSADSIIRSKLLLDLPQHSTYAMRRGTILEDFVQSLYHYRTGTTSILDRPDIQKAFRGAHPDHAFMVGNPDDVVLNSQQQMIIPDFKVRGELDWSSKLNLVNIAQCHWYGLTLEGNSGQGPTRYALAELDVPSAVADEMMRVFDNPKADQASKDALTERMIEVIDTLNMPGFGVRITAFDRNPDLDQALIDVGQRFWNEHVMTGKPYQREGHPLKEDIPQELADQVQTLLNDQLRNRIHERVAAEDSKITQGRIGSLLEEYNFRDWPISTPGITYSQGEKFDAKAAADRLVASGVPKDGLVKKKAGKLNVEKAEAVLREHGLIDDNLYDYPVDETAVKKVIKEHPSLDAGDFQKQSHRVALSTRNDDREILANLTNDVRRRIHAFDLAMEYPEIYSGPDEPGQGGNSGPQLA
jgi:hypothetical protein